MKLSQQKLEIENAQLKAALAQSQTRFQQTQTLLKQIQTQLVSATEQHTAEVEQFATTIEDKNRSIAALEHQIKLLLKKVTGSRQERIDPNQLLLFSQQELQQMFDQMEQDGPTDDLVEEETSTNKKRKKKRGRSGKLPSHLQREIIRYELDEQQRACPCCGDQRDEIGVESSEQLELIPAQLKVLQHDRVKYACKTCQEHVAIADKDPQPIEKGLPGPKLCAHTVLSKFGDHQPLYRQEDISSRLGYTIRRSTLCGWQAALADLALVLVLRMKHLLLQSEVIHTDDTSIKLLEGPGNAQSAKFWPYLGDCDHPYAVFEFTRTRGRDGPKKFLEGFEGYLQADAYSGYDCVYAGDLVKEVACWVHTRRYWHQAIDNDPVRANQALSFITRLAQVEKQLRQKHPMDDNRRRDFAAVAAGRQEHARPILDEFRLWLDEEKDNKRILPKSPIRSAMTYTLNQWEALCRYTERGYLSWDNNAAERLVKLPAIGRKNYLFVASANGGHRAAIHYSLVSSAKMNRVEPLAWLTALFSRLPWHRSGEAIEQLNHGDPITSTELDYLLPDVWLKANPQHRWTIDDIRRKEREKKEL